MIVTSPKTPKKKVGISLGAGAAAAGGATTPSRNARNTSKKRVL